MNRKVQIGKLLPDEFNKNDSETFVYSLFSGEKCIYVGQSSNLKSRLYQHLSDGKDFSSVDIESCGGRDANTVEADTIVKLKPILNKVLPSTDKYISFSAFKRQIQDLNFDSESGEGFVFSTETSAYMLSSRTEEILSKLKELIAEGEE